jgi:uncharacterized protein (DUF2249 family)
MITKDWKVSQVLDLYPETLDVFLGVSPHFSKLKNKILRKTVARRVTLEHAARVGGVNVNNLLMKLNKKAGLEVDTNKLTESNIEHEELNVLPDYREVRLDVRLIIESGTDPFKTIMKTVREMKEGEMLHLVNSFEPVPLYSVMETKGFTHASEKRGDEWHIWFRKKEESGNHAAADQAKTSTNENKHSEKIEEIDVRGMEPPRPMVTILETLSRLDETTTLLVHHHREPVLLYDKLEELGYEAETEKIDEQYYKIIIKKK